MAPHTAARSQENPTYPQRFPVPDDKVPWGVPFPSYAPVPYTFARKNADFADAADPKAVPELSKRHSYTGALTLDARSGAPINPEGRTGMSERGRLAKWGPNHAADPIVTRYHPESGELQLVVIKRKDTGMWALPGGMVDSGEAVSETVKREFAEEAGALQDAKQAERFRELAAALFGQGGETVYTGYVDDPRNTDNAWMETAALHFHCNEELGALLPLEAGEDAGSVKWVTIDHGFQLYAGHDVWVRTVEKNMHMRRMMALAARVTTVALPVLAVAAAVVFAARRAR